MRPADDGKKPAYWQPVAAQPFGHFFIGLQGLSLMHAPSLYCPPFARVKTGIWYIHQTCRKRRWIGSGCNLQQWNAADL